MNELSKHLTEWSTKSKKMQSPLQSLQYVQATCSLINAANNDLFKRSDLQFANQVEAVRAELGNHSTQLVTFSNT